MQNRPRRTRPIRFPATCSGRRPPRPEPRPNTDVIDRFLAAYEDTERHDDQH